MADTDLIQEEYIQLIDFLPHFQKFIDLCMKFKVNEERIVC